MNENEYGRRDEEYRDKISSLAAEIDRMQPNMLAEQKLGSRIHVVWSSQGEVNLREVKGQLLRPFWKNVKYF